MANVPSPVSKRLISAVPKFKRILNRAKERDVNESDTVTIVTDMLEEIFGFDKYSEITREYSIQGTFCDLAIKSAKKVEYLIEVKAIGLSLNDGHLKQAVNYAAREGIKWVVLTNGILWEIHRVSLEDRVKQEKLFSLDFSQINARQKDAQEILFLLCKRGVQKDLIGEYYEYRQSVNRYTVGATLLSDEVISIIRRELRKVKGGVVADVDEIKSLLQNEVLKRDILESDAGKDALKQLSKFKKKQAKAKSKKEVKKSKDKPEGQISTEMDSK
jgi:predicted type IV restriction endonuclease